MPYKDLEAQRTAKREWARAHRDTSPSGRTRPGTQRRTLLPDEFRIRRCEHVVALLEDQVFAVLNDEQARTLERARTVAFLASTILRAIEARDLVGRVDAVEHMLLARESIT